MTMQPLLTIEQTAERLGASSRFVRRQIELSRDGLPGGWPAGRTWVNLTPAARKAAIRIKWDGLTAYLEEQAAGMATL